VFSLANTNMGMFARICQSTNLLSHVLRHMSDSTSDKAFGAQEAIQIDRTIRSLIHLRKFEVDETPTSICLQTSVCYSALMTLNSSQPLATRKALSDEMVMISRIFQSRITENPRSGDKISPLLLYWAYQAVGTFASLYLETGDEAHLESWGVVDGCLKALARRWGIAGAYLQLLEARYAREIS